MTGIRVIATPSALDAIQWPSGTLVLRLAPDDVFAIGDHSSLTLADEHAIIEREAGFAGVWMASSAAVALVTAHAEWPLPADRPGLVQGMLAGLPVKILLEADRALVVTPAVFAAELEERIA